MSYPVFYSFRRCPFAMRARLALSLSQTPCELREIVLRNKPKDMLDHSPKGTVPVLILENGQVIDESLEIMIWSFQQNDPHGCLNGSVDDMLSLINENDVFFKTHLDRYKYNDRFDDTTIDQEREKAAFFLGKLEQRLAANGFLFKATPCLADYAIFPFIRQFAHVDLNWFLNQPFENLITWYHRHMESDVFKRVMKKLPVWQEGDALTLFCEDINQETL